MNKRIRTFIPASQVLFGTAMCLTLIGGCGGTPKAQVTGTVTLDGVAVEQGVIQFYPVNGAGQTVGGGIENGKYKVEASVGEMKVTISANKVVGKHKAYDTPDSPTIDKVAEMIPKKYNVMSDLKVTLKSGTNEGVDFDLKSK